MREHAKKFLEEVQQNGELKAKLQELSETAEKADQPESRKEVMQQLLALAKQYGYDLQETDFELSQEALSDEQLEAVAGGTVIDGADDADDELPGCGYSQLFPGLFKMPPVPFSKDRTRRP